MALGEVTSGVGNLPCDKCGKTMVLRHRNKDKKKFFGCEDFPACMHTMHYEAGMERIQQAQAKAKAEKESDELIEKLTSKTSKKTKTATDFAKMLKSKQAKEAEANKRKPYDSPVDAGGLDWISAIQSF